MEATKTWCSIRIAANSSCQNKHFHQIIPFLSGYSTDPTLRPDCASVCLYRNCDIVLQWTFLYDSAWMALGMSATVYLLCWCLDLGDCLRFFVNASWQSYRKVLALNEAMISLSDVDFGFYIVLKLPTFHTLFYLFISHTNHPFSTVLCSSTHLHQYS